MARPLDEGESMGETLKKGIVLIVEDDDTIRLALRRYLVGQQFEVLVASDGLGALKILLDYDIDVVVTDYKMDVLGGNYWVKFLVKYCSELTVIVTSGFLRPEFEIPFPVLYKPFEFDEVSAMISSALSEA